MVNSTIPTCQASRFCHFIFKGDLDLIFDWRFTVLLIEAPLSKNTLLKLSPIPISLHEPIKSISPLLFDLICGFIDIPQLNAAAALFHQAQTSVIVLIIPRTAVVGSQQFVLKKKTKTYFRKIK
jgi:hypothetical protein